LVLTLGLCTVPLVVPEESLYRLASVGDELAGGDLTGRTAFWNNALELWSERPFIGIGGAAFDDAVASLYGRPRSAHNSFIAVLTELGLFGIAMVIVILAMAIGNAWRLSKRDAYFWLALGATWFIGNMALTWIQNQPTWMFLSLLASSAVLATHEKHNRPEWEMA
jgi:O-antigen ligase